MFCMHFPLQCLYLKKETSTISTKTFTVFFNPFWSCQTIPPLSLILAFVLLLRNFPCESYFRSKSLYHKSFRQLQAIMSPRNHCEVKLCLIRWMDSYLFEYAFINFVHILLIQTKRVSCQPKLFPFSRPWLKIQKPVLRRAEEQYWLPHVFCTLGNFVPY